MRKKIHSEQIFRDKFQAEYDYSDEGMAELDKRIAVDDCWGDPPMSYKRLLELAEEYGELHMHTVIYYANHVYYGDLDKPPHSLAGETVHERWKEWQEKNEEILKFQEKPQEADDGDE